MRAVNELSAQWPLGALFSALFAPEGVSASRGPQQKEEGVSWKEQPSLLQRVPVRLSHSANCVQPLFHLCSREQSTIRFYVFSAKKKSCPGRRTKEPHSSMLEMYSKHAFWNYTKRKQHSLCGSFKCKGDFLSG